MSDELYEEWVNFCSSGMKKPGDNGGTKMGTVIHTAGTCAVAVLGVLVGAVAGWVIGCMVGGTLFDK